MKVVVLAIGSRGDVEPFCALVQQLLRRNDDQIQVEFFVEQNQKHLTEPLVKEISDNLKIHFFPFQNAMFMRKSGSRKKDNRSHQLDETARIYKEVIFPSFGMVWDATKNADVVVSCNLTNMLCILIRQKTMLENLTKIPKFVFAHLQPLAPNTIFPCYRTAPKKEVVTAILDHFFGNISKDDIDTSDIECFDSYWKIDQQLYQRLFEASDGSLPPMCSWEEYKNIFSGKHPDFMIANAYSKYLIPTIAGTSPLLGENMMDIGPLADSYQPYQATVSQDMERVVQFCEATTDRPICIGFGSMPFARQQEVFNALKRLGDPRTILVGNALTPNEHHENILHVSSLPYPWLLPKCSLMICHGGMGVLAACLRAGIPAIVCPAMGDQFLTGPLVQGLGLGRQAGQSLHTLTAEQLVEAIQKVQSNQGMIERCRRVGELIRSEKSSGVERIANWIEKQGNS